MAWSARELDHTADLGLDIEADSLSELYRGGVLALTDLLTDRSAIRGRLSRRVRVTGPDVAATLVFWMGEVIGEGEIHNEVYSDVRILEATPACVEGELLGEPRDLERHPARHEVKAVTWHDLDVGESDGRWFAHVILDI